MVIPLSGLSEHFLYCTYKAAKGTQKKIKATSGLPRKSAKNIKKGQRDNKVTIFWFFFALFTFFCG